MEHYTLPATTYQPPSRLARKHILNTIIEDESSEHEEEQERCSRGRSRSPVTDFSNGSYSPVPSLSSSISSYYRTRRRSKDFDDLYDVSDSESEREYVSKSTENSKPIRHESDNTKSDHMSNAIARGRCPTLVIPSPRHWPTIQKFQKNSSIPPTPPAKIPISPAVLSLLMNHPISTAPPSLDGSLPSDQIACLSAPPTPDTQSNVDSGEKWTRMEVAVTTADCELSHLQIAEITEVDIQLDDFGYWDESIIELESTAHDVEEDPSTLRPESPILGREEDLVMDIGVQLPADALDTLRHLSIDSLSESSFPMDFAVTEEMQEIVADGTIHKSVDMTPASETSDYSFSQLSIPSPGAFFTSLGSNARHTWCVFGSEPASAAPPSSTTAEKFYSAPWNIDPRFTVESTLEIDDDVTGGPPTARQLPFTSASSATITNDLEMENDSELTVQELETADGAKDFDAEYEKGIWQSAESSLDRTSGWLAAQTSYMEALRGVDSPDATTNESGSIFRRPSLHSRLDSLGSPIKKAVKFLESETARLEGSMSTSQSKADPLFYHAFQHISNATSPTDSFIHRHARYDSLQASRASLLHEHIHHLLGNYQTVDIDRPTPLRPISMMPGKSSPTEQTTEQRVIARVEKERQALDQVAAAMWIVEATRFLNGGRLLNGPADELLAQPLPMYAQGQGQMKLLDLGGQPNCDWAWHCARDYPNAKVYTASSDDRSLNSNLRGPSNHRSIRVTNLWQLPFPDNYFDVISARSLFAFLKNEKPLGEVVDEYDMCIRECRRCLKPGGFLEFFLLDSEIVHSGPRGTAVSVEFGFNLRARGYDPAPTKAWLSRLRRVGLVDIKRAWTFLPAGALKQDPHVWPETPPPHQSFYEEQILAAEAVQGPVGSTIDTASISGLVGSWMWEQWMLKLQMEMGKENLLEGVGVALEESKSTGAGWRCLSGWAQKV
ncbi:hypothetical protein MMC14_007505 [Varicellaria rhodocarpa]|nr:hypothetical protein [Varicellaria rhodocarpa]